MLNQIRRWSAAHPQWTLILLACAVLGPFLAKPFNLDDPLFIWLAQQIQAHPLNPFGFSVNWYTSAWPMWAVTENPPLAGYYFALAGSLSGWSELSLHLAGLPAAIAVLLGTYRLARRCCGQPLLAAGAVLFTPLFLVSANTVMCDVLMLAFWIWAVVFWVEGLEDNALPKIIAAGVLVGLALLTKYYAVALVPLLAVHGALLKRRVGPWMIGLLVPLAALGAYQWATLRWYGRPLFSAAANYAASAQDDLGFTKLAGLVIAFAFLGGGAASALFLAPALWRRRTLALTAGSAVMVGGALCASGMFLQKYSALNTTAARVEVSAQFILWAMGGGVVLLLVVAEILKNPRAALSWLLALWVVGTFFFAGFVNWTVNGRSLLPLLPAVGILLARRWESVRGQRPLAWQAGLALSALLSLLVAQADFQLAVAVRRSAEEACARYRQSGKMVWFEGHWGFQYYMQKLGADIVDFKHPRQRPGDVLLLPQHNTDVSAPAAEIIANRDLLSVPNPSLLATWQTVVGAGFYSSVIGPLPFALGNSPPEVVYLFELKAANPQPPLEESPTRQAPLAPDHAR